MNVQIVHHQMDSLGFRVLKGQLEGYMRELNRRTIRRGECEVPARLRLYRAENIGCTTALVFVIPPRFPSRCSGRGWPDVGMQRDRLLIQAHHRLLWIAGLFVRLQYIFHLRDVVFIEFGHGRGRDAGHPAPPARIPTSGTTAWGSYLG